MRFVEKERWLPVVGYEGLYEVSNRGRVQSIDHINVGLDGKTRFFRGKPRSLKKRKGRVMVTLCRGRTRRTVFVSSLVLEAFVGPRPNGLDGCHWNDVGTENTVENLRWDTRSANIHDSVRNGNHVQARKTHCPHNHPYTEENTYRCPRGKRRCRTCRAERKVA